MKTINLIAILTIIILFWAVCIIFIFFSKCARKKCCEKYKTEKHNLNKNSQIINKEPAKIENFTIFGERCSGTNFLENAISKNFDLDLTWDYCWKHWFGNHVNFSDSDNTLFLCIYRDPVDWINSLYKRKHHISEDIKTVKDFLTKPILSMDGNDKKKELQNTRNIYTGKIYKNIFELRAVKLHFLLKEMPRKAKHVEVISYEDFCNNYNKIMENLKKKYNLTVKTHKFPELILDIYRGDTIDSKPYEHNISKSKIIPKLSMNIEKMAGYSF